jgi:hypothetical protein
MGSVMRSVVGSWCEETVVRSGGGSGAIGRSGGDGMGLGTKYDDSTTIVTTEAI